MLEKLPIFDMVSSIDKTTSNFILKVVKSLCTPEENWVHASIAGGRKTMSLFLGMAMQFYAKEIDEMSHVLVNPPFENHPDFFYPPNPPRELVVFDPSKNRYSVISTDKANVSLAMIPFVKLRKLKVDFKESDFLSHVNSVQKSIKCPLPQIQIHERDLSVTINSTSIQLTPMERAIYFYFLNIKKECSMPECPPNCRDCFISCSDIDLSYIAQLYKKIMRGESLKVISFEESLKEKRISEWFLQHRSRINKKISEADPTGMCSINSYGRYGSRVYGILLPKERIF